MIRPASFSLSIALAAFSSLAMAERVTCKSHDFSHNHCGMDTRDGIRLVEQQSEASCIQGRSWGIDRDGVWVDEGCEAVFESRYGGNYHNEDHYRRDERRRDRRPSYRDECRNTIAGNQCGR